MKPTTRQITNYINSTGVPFSKFNDKFTVEIAGEEYTIQRLGIRYWLCKHHGVPTVLRSQYEVIAWLDSKW